MDAQKACNKGYWSARYLRKYINNHLESGGTLNDIFKIDVDKYNQTLGMSDSMPLKIKPTQSDKETWRSLRIDTMLASHYGKSYNKDWKAASLKIAKYTDFSLFEQSGDEFVMKPGTQPRPDQISDVVAVIEHVSVFVEEEIDSLVESGVIAVKEVVTRRKKGKTATDEEEKPEPLVRLRSTDAEILPIIRVKTQAQKVISNPFAVFKFVKAKDSETILKLHKCVDASSGKPEDIVLTTDNILEMIPSKTEFRAMISLSRLNITSKGISIASYIDSMQFRRVEAKTEVNLSLDDNSEKDDDDKSDDESADVGLE
jgi:hypothetical protein